MKCSSVDCSCFSHWRSSLKGHIPGKQLSKLYAITFVNLFAMAFSISMMFPFLPFMVLFLVPGVDEKTVGRYAGVVGGARFAGRTLGSYFWGVMADKRGRKPVIIISSIFMSICILAFGFSVNLAMAVITRFLIGLVNATMTCFKAMISEASDDRFQAFGVSIIGAAWSLGFILGPAVSGAIADPVGQYNLTISNSFLHNYLTKFPYSLPCIVSTIFFIVGLVPTAFCLPETLGKKKNRRRSEIDQIELELLQEKMEGSHKGNSDVQDQEWNTNDRTKLVKDDEEVEENNTVPTGNAGTCSSLESLKIRHHGNGSELNNSEGVIEVDIHAENDDEVNNDNSGNQEVERRTCLYKLKLMKQSLKMSVQNSLTDVSFFLCNSITLIPLVIYMVSSYEATGYSEVFSLWAFTQPHYGGLGFSLRKIGLILTIVGVIQLPVELFAFIILEKKLKAIKVYCFGAIILTFSIPMLPHLHYMVNTTSSWFLWIVLIAVVFVINSTTSVIFSAIILFINNSVTFDKLGAMNGLAMALTSMTRCVAPVLTGLLFSFSLSDVTLNIGFPLDYNLVFVIFSVIYLSCVFLVSCLPESINYQKIIEDV